MKEESLAESIAATEAVQGMDRRARRSFAFGVD